jgi:hypothetical protein
MEVRGQLHTPAVLSPGTNRLKDKLGYTAGVDVVEKREIALFCRKLNHGPSSHGLLLYRLNYPVTARKEILFMYFNFHHSCCVFLN